MGGEILIEEGDVVFRLTGWDRLWAAKRELRVPLSHVVGVSTEKADWDSFKQLKMGGTGVFGVVKDGRWWGKDGYWFYEMHDPERCVTVRTTHERYRTIVFEVPDKEFAANMINKALPRVKA